MQITTLQLHQLRSPTILLRPVRLESVEFAEMLDSIRDHGLWQPLLVRPVAEDLYEVVEGNYRYTCCKYLRHNDIPCIIRDLSDTEVLLAQLQANGIRPETTPVEFSERLSILLDSNPGITVPRLAKMIRKSPDWIRKILRLRKLCKGAQAKLRDGDMPAQAAYELAYLPAAVQEGFVEEAVTLPVKEFLAKVRAERKRIREACSSKYIKDHLVNQEHPIPYLRLVKEIKAEYRTPQNAGPVLVKANAKTPMDGWQACLAWVLHMDVDSLVEQEKMIATRRDQKLKAEERRVQERRRLRELREAAARTTSQHPRIEL